MTRRGFTLIELTVVVAVVTLLLSIVLAALGRSLGEARLVACLITNREKAAAAGAFATDHDDRLPIAGRIFVSELDDASEMPNVATYAERGVFGDKTRPLPHLAALAPYLQVPIRTGSRAELEADLLDEGLMAAFACPADGERRPGRLIANMTLSWSSPMGLSSYGFNDAVTGIHPASGPRAYGFVRNVTRPSSTMLYADARPRSGEGGYTPHWLSFFNESDETSLLGCFRGTDGGSPSVFPVGRHRGSMTVTFVDGHGARVSTGSASQLDAVGVSRGVRAAAGPGWGRTAQR